MFKIIKCIQTGVFQIPSDKKFAFRMCQYSCETRKNIAAVIYGPKDMRLEEFPLQKLKDHEVLAQIEVCGICGSDMHIYIKGAQAGVPVKKPYVIGHEASGTIVEVGKDVTHLKVGDRVAIEPQYGCRKCEFCKTGRYNICPNQYRSGMPHFNGNLCQFMTFPSDLCFKLPKNMDFEDGALIQPLTVTAHTMRRIRIVGGDTVCIMGAGTMGLMAFLCAKYCGASKVLLLDIDDFKLCKAKELGCKNILNIKGLSELDIIKAIHENLGSAPNKTLDCVGVKETLAPCVLATKRGGTVGIVGMASENVPLPLIQAIVKELNIVASYKIVNTYPLAIDMVSSGRVKLKPLISHKFKFEDTKKAFDLIANQTEPFIKVLIEVNPSSKC